ncbi:hypothetical protein J6590_081557 [Homalodisca vitripennis]|nr:hypothetical protein J6590_081557 [Homalodisca vitripennis]
MRQLLSKKQRPCSSSTKKAIRILAGLTSLESCRQAFGELKILTVVSLYICEAICYTINQKPEHLDFLPSTSLFLIFYFAPASSPDHASAKSLHRNCPQRLINSYSPNPTHRTHNGPIERSVLDNHPRNERNGTEMVWSYLNDIMQRIKKLTPNLRRKLGPALFLLLMTCLYFTMSDQHRGTCNTVIYADDTNKIKFELFYRYVGSEKIVTLWCGVITKSGFLFQEEVLTGVMAISERRVTKKIHCPVKKDLNQVTQYWLSKKTVKSFDLWRRTSFVLLTFILDGCETLLRTLVQRIIEKYINGHTNYTNVSNVVRFRVTQLVIDFLD